MKHSRVDFWFSFSLIVIGITTLVLLGASVLGIAMPDVLRRALGILDLCAIPVFIYAVVRKWRNAK